MSEEPKMEVATGLPSAAEGVTDLKEIIEALLFASDEQVTVETLRAVFDDMNRDKPDGQFFVPTGEEIRMAIDSLNADYAETRRAYRIQQLAGGYVFATDKKFAAWVGKLFKEKARRKLSQTAVETLAIIAYKQPITKSEIEFIRGVNADYIMKTLLEKNLATITGRAHSPGRPLLYGTTPEFLKHFGLNEITDLPKPREIEELLGETELEVEKRMLANQEELEFKEKLHEKLDPNSRAPHIPRKKSKLQEPHPDIEEKTVIEKATPLPPPVHPSETIETGSIVDQGTDTRPVVDEPAESPDEFKDRNSVEGQPSAQVPLADRLYESVDAEHLDTPQISSGQVSTDEEQFIGSEPEKLEARIEPAGDGAREPEPVAPSKPPVILHTVGEQPETNESKKGWSTWKTKIQTFFRKLFG